MSADATSADIAAIVDQVEDAGGEAFVSRGVSQTVIGLVGDVELFGTLNLPAMPAFDGRRPAKAPGLLAL
jgi:3-deoxy-7-phosphoheptulonate synthase